MIDRSNFAWPEGKTGAVSLTYDDALPVHYEKVAPAWEAHGLRVTFYTNILSLMNHPAAWREVAARGHELGNHSIFHPCRKDDAERMGWLPDEYDLRTYTARRWTDEMRAASLALQLLDGKTERSFGNTCCHTELGQGESIESLDPLIAELFVAGRGAGSGQVVDIETANYNALGHFSGDGKEIAALRAEIDQAVSTGGWIIYMIHGVGQGTHSLYIEPEEHQRLVDHLGGQQDSIWVAPVVEIARYLRSCDPDLA